MFPTDWDEIWHAAMTCCSLQAHTIFCVQEEYPRERWLTFGDLGENVIKTDLRLDAYRPISFKLDMMMEDAKFYSLMPV